MLDIIWGWEYVHKDPLSHPLDHFPINLKHMGG